MLAETGARPKVFLANLGPVAAFTTRATFAKNFFEAGGFEAWGNAKSASPAEIVRTGLEWLEAGGDAVKRVCLCSSDAVYAHDAAEAARLFRDAGVTWIGLADRPGDLERAVREAGVQVFIYAGVDALAVLWMLYARPE